MVTFTKQMHIQISHGILIYTIRHFVSLNSFSGTREE